MNSKKKSFRKNKQVQVNLDKMGYEIRDISQDEREARPGYS
jgi:hypothetical protein